MCPIDVTRPLRSFPLASPQPGPWPTPPRTSLPKPSSFAIAPGCQEHSEALAVTTVGSLLSRVHGISVDRLKELLRISAGALPNGLLAGDVRHVQGANIEAQRGAHHRNADAIEIIGEEGSD